MFKLHLCFFLGIHGWIMVRHHYKTAMNSSGWPWILPHPEVSTLTGRLEKIDLSLPVHDILMRLIVLVMQKMTVNIWQLGGHGYSDTLIVFRKITRLRCKVTQSIRAWSHYHNRGEISTYFNLKPVCTELVCKHSYAHFKLDHDFQWFSQ